MKYLLDTVALVRHFAATGRIGPKALEIGSIWIFLFFSNISLCFDLFCQSSKFSNELKSQPSIKPEQLELKFIQKRT